MRTLMTIFSLCLPAAARAMYGPGPAVYDCGAGPGGLLAGAAYAVIAVLGYWVLLQAVKESAAWLKRSGYVLGGVLAVAGLLGLLCSVASHSRCSSSRSCLGPGMMPPGHPPIGDMAPPDLGAKKGGRAR